ncbi:SxtJ family membrane protein [Methylocapsa polymorpha]|uniref:SxtJ family membrane protein n=1 Tax=Methylocapsa polymorpha TaxID=3080828 RepID=A0ABZ0HRF9_9HYPH|nr:SxtJ family membrane protein [Methylocapsa sp. RX1]
MQTHETVLSFRKIAIGSNRKFGLTFGVIFAILGVWPLLRHADSPRWPLIVLSVAFLIVAIFLPNWLTPLNRAWFKLGFALNKIANPIIMGVLFFGAVVPMGWFLRKKGEDLLRLEMKPDAETYWIERQPPGPAQGTLTKQF